MKKILSFLAVSSPLSALAAGTPAPNPQALKPYSDAIVGIINGLLVPVLMAIAFIVFLWGIYKYFIQGADNDTERATGRQFVLWSVIGFAVILSVWGLVAVVMNVFGLQPGTSNPGIPTFNSSGS